MALGTAHNTITTGANYIPELWSNEVIAAYKKNVVMRNLVTVINHQGKKGDTLHIPNFTRSLASVKAASTQVTLVAPTHGVTDITIDKHYEYSRLIEDILDVQALPTLRQQYTDDAGYALARQVDFNLHVLGTGLQGGTLDATPGTPAANTLTYTVAKIGSDGSTAWSASANTNTGNGASLSDAGIRKMIQTLDDVDNPLDGRALVIPPVEKKTLLGISRFTEQAFIGDGKALRTGMFGEIYGLPVYVSTACPTIQAADASTNYRVGLMFHKGAFALVEQMSVRSQTQYKQEYLGDLFTADTIYGIGELRDDAGVAFVVPA